MWRGVTPWFRGVDLWRGSVVSWLCGVAPWRGLALRGVAWRGAAWRGVAFLRGLVAAWFRCFVALLFCGSVVLW